MFAWTAGHTEDVSVFDTLWVTHGRWNVSTWFHIQSIYCLSLSSFFVSSFSLVANVILVAWRALHIQMSTSRAYWKPLLSHTVKLSVCNIQYSMWKMNFTRGNIVVMSVYAAALISTVTALCSSNTFSLSVTNPGCVSAMLCVPDIHLQFITQHLVLVTWLFLLDPQRADQNRAQPNKQKPKKLTFRRALQFPPPSFLTWRRQAVVLVFLRVLLFAAWQESVLLGRAPALTLGAVLCPAGGRVSGDPVLHFPLLLFREAGVGRPVSVPTHVSIVDLCHGRPTHPGVAVAHTHTAFERATALDLQAGEEEVEMLTSWPSISLRDYYYDCSSMLQLFPVMLWLSAAMTYQWIYCSWHCNKPNRSGVTTNHPACLKKRSNNKTAGIIGTRRSALQKEENVN